MRDCRVNKFAFRRLEPYAVKVARTILRRGCVSNGTFLSYGISVLAWGVA